ncbi:MAG: starch-binding protein [Muribaculaceae bacterium]|nr:starch-binding protein [Muribaculaceae bacterium]
MNHLRKFVCGAVIASSAMASLAATFVGDRTDFRDETIYFAMTTRFYDGDPDNNVYCWDGVNNVKDPEWRGDFKGLIEKLPYIKALGFTAIWITPVVENASGLDYHGYHAMDFSKIDHRYVDKNADAAQADVAFKELIDAVHAQDMKIILDIVIQHTGNFGESHLAPMFKKDYTKDLANIEESMIPLTKSTGGILPDNYANLQPAAQYAARLDNMKNTDYQNHDIHNYYHHKAWFDWDDPSRWWGQIAGDCVDLNTEHPGVSQYIVDSYARLIKMGLDGFRIDTAGHIPRLAFNKNFIPQFLEASESDEAKRNRGNNPFFMYGEVCARSMEVIYRGDNYNCSPCYYTWKESKDYPWDYDPKSWDSIVAIPTQTEGSQDYETVSGHTNWDSCNQSAVDDKGHAASILKKSDNHKLNGNEYHTPDHSKHSGLNVIDFAMHWNFNSASGAYGVRTQDDLYNDATYNVVYVDSHDYAPDSNYRFKGDQGTWAENLSLMFTFRGIPCLYYGSEVEFQKGKDIDKGAILALKETGRAYFGGYIEGEVQGLTDFAEYTGATGNMASTLSYPLALHIQRLNKIRAAVPALRKGQYSNDGCSGKFAFKRRYTDDKVDSYALVTMSGDATFTGVLNGRYVDCVTGDVQNVTDGKLTAKCTGKGNLRVYVLDTDKTKAPGKVGEDGKYLYASSPVTGNWVEWPDETMPDETWTVKPNTGGGGGGNNDIEEPENPIEPSMAQGEQAVFFEVDAEGEHAWKGVNVYAWNGGTQYAGAWSGTAMTYLGKNVYKWTYTGSGKIPETAQVIFNSGGKQTADLKWVNGGYYKYSGYVKTIEGAGDIEDDPIIPTDPTTYTAYFDNTAGNWSSVKAWVWDENNGNKNYTGNKWPGQDLSLDPASGYYKYSCTVEDANPKMMIIFNDGSKQTANLEFVHNGIYNADGFTNNYMADTGVKNVDLTGIRVYVSNGSLVIESDRLVTIPVVRVDGMTSNITVGEGKTSVDLPKGLYIVAGKKIIL